MEQLPLIRLEIEEMKHAILHHFNLYQKDVSDTVKKEIEKSIKEFDFVNAVKKATEEILQSEIEAYFKYGEGFKMIQESIKETLNKVFNKRLTN